MVGAHACPLEPNDARWLAAELPDAFRDVAADMRRAAPAVSKGIEVALEDGSDEEFELDAPENPDLQVGPDCGPTGAKTDEKWGPNRGRMAVTVLRGSWVDRSYSEANAPLRSSRLRWPPGASPGRWWGCGT